MAVIRKPYGTAPNGKLVEQLTITGEGGLTVSFITYGATLTNLLFGGKDVVLGYNSLEDYLNDTASISVTVGRYANRIAGGMFELNGKTYDVGRNEKGIAHLHGGSEGFQKQHWDVAETADNAFTLRYFSPDGEMGYPAALTVEFTVTVTANNALVFSYRAVSDGDTVLNLTQHAYFNLAGYGGGDILDTEMQLFADEISVVDEHLIPTGERLKVAGTPFDFRVAKPIGRDIGADHPQLKIGGGYDHNFILGDTMGMRHAATLYCAKSGIRMECHTDQPGIQVYTGNRLTTNVGKGGAMTRYQGVCLETQHFPDSPNHPEFPSTVLRAGEVFTSTTEYRFSIQ